MNRPVNLTLNVDLVRRARLLTTNISKTVEDLQAGYVQADEAKRADLTAQIDQWAAASEDVVTRYASPADEHVMF